MFKKGCKSCVFCVLIAMIVGISAEGLLHVFKMSREDKVVVWARDAVVDISKNQWNSAYAVSKYGSTRLSRFCNERKMVCDMYAGNQLFGLGVVTDLKVASRSVSDRYAHVMFDLGSEQGHLLVLLVKEGNKWKVDMLLLKGL